MSATRVEFDVELERLRGRLLEMASAADEMIVSAMRALTEQDIELTREVVRSDDGVDQINLEVEKDCIRLIALQQPVGRDLRLIGTALTVITDIERMGDYAVDIAKIGRRITRHSFYKPLVDLPHLADLVRQMLRDAMLAFVNRDLNLAMKVALADDAVDDLFHQQRDYLLDLMQRDSSVIYLAANLLFVGKYLERIADHIVNIAERVYYVETGELKQLAKSHKTNS